MRPTTLNGSACNCCSAMRARLLSGALIKAPMQHQQHLHARGADAQQPSLTTRLECAAPESSNGALLGRRSVTVALPDEVLEKLSIIAAKERCKVDDLLTYAAEMYLQDKLMGRNAVASESMDTVYVLEPIITLVDGLLHGEHTVAQALKHGDMGLGTLDLLDGEVVVYQGVAYHQSADGVVRVLTGRETTPYMALCHQLADKQMTMKVTTDTDYEGLQKLLKASAFRTRNVFYAIEVRGRFPSVKARVVRKQDRDRPLVEVAQDQALFSFDNEEGVLVGFFSPEYMGSSINVPGFHLHYLSDDKKRGGHLLGCIVEAGATIKVQEIHRIKVDLPFRDAFMDSDLERDIKKEIEDAEKGKE